MILYIIEQISSADSPVWLLTVLFGFYRRISHAWCNTNRATPFAPARTSDLALHISCLPWSASSNRHGWFQDITEVPHARPYIWECLFCGCLFSARVKVLVHETIRHGGNLILTERETSLSYGETSEPGRFRQLRSTYLYHYGFSALQARLR